MDQTAIQKQVEFVVVGGNERERVDRLAEVREQPPRERECLVLETCREAVVDNEVHAS